MLNTNLTLLEILTDIDSRRLGDFFPPLVEFLQDTTESVVYLFNYFWYVLLESAVSSQTSEPTGSLVYGRDY